MALNSTCPKCGHSSFETVIEEPSGSNYKLQFVRCSSCGCVVGVNDYFNISSLLMNLAKKLNIHDITR